MTIDRGCLCPVPCALRTDGYMMVGFSKGWVIAISTHMKEIGEELQSLKVHESKHLQ